MRLGHHLAASGTGRLHIDRWVLDGGPFPENTPSAGNHHMGGTRMATRAAEGIVDGDCRVFGQQNLFVAGSSVFPTAGHVNPTLTIVQLALRLGAHLAATF
jgi:choline dehydrogenase-like flavoprotein